MTDSPATPALDDLVYEALERIEGDGLGVLDELCQRHPDLADALRRRIARLVDCGLIALPGDAAEREFPERLGDFRLLEALGGGGMGIVYRAEQLSLGREVALKIVRPDQLYFPGARERFVREVEIIAGLAHPGIVPVFAVGEDAGVPYFAMERVHGVTLGDAIEDLAVGGKSASELQGADLAATIERLTVDEHPGASTLYEGSWQDVCLRIVREVAEALEHAHRRGIVHRDVKPSNVMITPKGRVMLFDFGLSATSGTDRLTRTGTAVGSIPYMSPEQVRSDTAVDARSDVYALGVTLYELLSLQLPFQGDSALELADKIQRGKAPRLVDQNPRVSWEVATVVATAMELDPDRRYASAADFGRDLDHALARRPIEARPASTWLRARRWVERHPAASVALILGSLLFIGGPSAWLVQQRIATKKIEAERDLALSRWEDVVRLSASEELRDLVADADELWPLDPALIPSYEAWLRRARELLAGLADHQRKRAQLEPDGRVEPRSSGMSAPGDPTSESVPTYLTPETRDRWWSRQLDELIHDLEAFGDPSIGLIEGIDPEHGWGVERRLEFAQSWLDSMTAGRPWAEAWERERAALRDASERAAYGGLELPVQLGLLPLGADPESGLAEFCVLASGLPPERDPKGRLELDEQHGIVLVLVPGGRFAMGSQAEDPQGPNYDPDPAIGTGPVHDVELEPFFIAKHEMSQAQWLRLVAVNPSAFDAGSAVADGRVMTVRHPVEQVTWDQAMFALGRFGLALPTEAQWEYACRAGSGAVFWFGSRQDLWRLDGIGNIADSFATRFGMASIGKGVDRDLDDGHLVHAPVGSFRPNPFGLFDTCGNVAEWCRDPRGTYDFAPRPGDGLRPVLDDAVRCVRGGSFSDPSSLARSAARSFAIPSTVSPSIGLRAARAVEL